jgi:hypothetical protein
MNACRTKGVTASCLVIAVGLTFSIALCASTSSTRDLTIREMSASVGRVCGPCETVPLECQYEGLDCHCVSTQAPFPDPAEGGPWIVGTDVDIQGCKAVGTVQQGDCKTRATHIRCSYFANCDCGEWVTRKFCNGGSCYDSINATINDKCADCSNGTQVQFSDAYEDDKYCTTCDNNPGG